MSYSPDEFSRLLFEEAKRFLERAKEAEEEQAVTANLHAALVLGIASVEAHINSIAEDFLTRGELNPLEVSILAEKEVTLEKGTFAVSDRLKMYRLEERIEFLYARFARTPLDKTTAWWTQFKAGLHLRNELIHPKKPPSISRDAVELVLTAVVQLLDSTYKAIYRRPFPSANRGLDSEMEF